MLQRRSIRLYGGRLALLAIWLQLALSFAHIHAYEIFRYGQPVAQGHHLAEVTGDHRTPLGPSQGDSTTEDACAICANMALAGSLLLPDLAKLPLPSLTGLASASSGQSFGLTAAPHLLFLTRAPPLV